jgi:hypothetical protein
MTQEQDRFFYSPSTELFYRFDVDSSTPDDAIEISTDMYITLLNGKSAGRNIIVENGIPFLSAPSPEALQASITAQIIQRLDNFARTRGYDNILSACTYATSANPEFATEGRYCVKARNDTWVAVYAILDAVLAGERPAPESIADIEADLPVLAWPETALLDNGLIGTQGAQGFGVGTYPGTLPVGFSVMFGTSDPASENYGNYQYSDGSIMVFIPRFYYRIGHASSPRYSKYGLNAVDIVGIETFANKDAANTAGYAMHRAFIDGGAEKTGFFIDKYKASKNGNGSCRSIKNAPPILMGTSQTGYNSIAGEMTPSEGNPSGRMIDAVLLGRSRGIGKFSCSSYFMHGALKILSLAHAQASTNDTFCAWYDQTYNFPKGSNKTGALQDFNDPSVTYVSAGNSAQPLIPLTGSGMPFAKTTHNGQNCGVCDINGCVYEISIGVTTPGSSVNDESLIGSGNSYVLKTSAALANLTPAWNGTNCAYGTASKLNDNYDVIQNFFPWGADDNADYRFGNGSNRVFSSATSGTEWLRTCCGVIHNNNSTSTTGTNQFGQDFIYKSNTANNMIISYGRFNSDSSSGIFAQHVKTFCGMFPNALMHSFRCATYGE